MGDVPIFVIWYMWVHFGVVSTKLIDYSSGCGGGDGGGVMKHLFLCYVLTHCRLNRLPHTIYWKSPISFLGISGYEI